MNVCYIIVTHNFSVGLKRTVAAIDEAAPGTSIIVVDNSTDRSTALATKRSVAAYYPNVRYILSDDTNRFAAYNLALPLIDADAVVFRTDDDEFVERGVLNVCSQLGNADYVYADYTFDGEGQIAAMDQRPLETFVFKSALFDDFAFGLNPGSDWAFLSELKRSDRKGFKVDGVIMHKKGHGRP